MSMIQSLSLVTLVVSDYDEAIAFYVHKLGFDLIENTPLSAEPAAKRWVVVAPPGGSGARLLLAKAAGPEQQSRVGNQTGGRVFLFLQTDDFDRDFHRYTRAGVVFIGNPRDEVYGKVAVFQDGYGNRWDLIGPKVKS
jgi:catechol 2,3-dioxygenase-like lactoylglutathione lyase family enzyme